jgi:hypothetical protein
MAEVRLQVYTVSQFKTVKVRAIAITMMNESIHSLPAAMSRRADYAHSHSAHLHYHKLASHVTTLLCVLLSLRLLGTAHRVDVPCLLITSTSLHFI